MYSVLGMMVHVYYLSTQKLRQEVGEFKDSLGYIARLFQKQANSKKFSLSTGKYIQCATTTSSLRAAASPKGACRPLCSAPLPVPIVLLFQNVTCSHAVGQGEVFGAWLVSLRVTFLGLIM